MKGLLEILSTATLYPDNPPEHILAGFRTRAIEYCKEHGLEEKFLEAVASSPEWERLANATQVHFFIEEPLKEHRGNCTRLINTETGVFLRIFDSGKTPVIKVVI